MAFAFSQNSSARTVSTLILTGLAFVAPRKATAQPPTNGLVLWLDSSVAASIQTNSGGYVMSWSNLAPGANNPVSYSGADDNGTSIAFNSAPPNMAAGPNGAPVVNFNGEGYLDNLNFSSETPQSMTFFLLGSAATNFGNFSAFMSFRAPGQNDYQTGLNVDQGQDPSTNFNRLNVECAKAGGNAAFNLPGATCNSAATM
ncbi:MAG TPA: hypothetical protein VGO59_16950 [Verrucomicrobiae bacterium]|jgi:hypothetical protein